MLRTDRLSSQSISESSLSTWKSRDQLVLSYRISHVYHGGSNVPKDGKHWDKL